MCVRWLRAFSYGSDGGSRERLGAAELLAKEQINSEVAVCVNGREYLIDPIIKDGGSRWPLYAHQAKQ